MTAATSVSARTKARRQFQSLFDYVIPFKATLDEPSLVDAAGDTATVAVPGAAVGDFVLVSMGVDVAGITVTGYVSAANVVSVRFQNESTGTVDLASTTIKGVVLSPSSQLFF